VSNPLNILQNNRGIALLITISVTTILVAAALEYNRKARYMIVSSAVTRDRITLAQMATAGAHAAMALLIKDKSESTTDSLLEDWANPEKIAAFVEELGFDDGGVAVRITDELSRIQVNALVNFPQSNQFNEAQRSLWERFLGNMVDSEEQEENGEPLAIINSLKDWLDSGDDDAISGLSGAESNYYEELDPAYPSRNGPVADLNELVLVKGITPELFYGNKETAGISPYLTVHGMTPGQGTSYAFPGRININTADPLVLVALLPSENLDLVQAFAEYRQELADGKEGYDFSSPTWYKNIPGFADVNLDTNLITTTSDFFRITSTASLHETTAIVNCVVQRTSDPKSGKWSCKILEWNTH